MKQETMEKWVAALRSGEYMQTRGQLRNSHMAGGTQGFCCLGVLIDVLAPERWCVNEADVDSAWFVDSEFGDKGLADGEPEGDLKEVCDLHNASLIQTLVEMNDGRKDPMGKIVDGKQQPVWTVKPKSFEEIADFIEENYERL